MPETRRTFLRRAAAGGAALVGAATLAGSASAQTVPEFAPDGVATADYPEDLLREYQPLAATSIETREQLTGIYAWRAQPSDDADTDLEALYYWFQYSHQRSWLDRRLLGLFSEVGDADAHFLDHEPLIVYRDPSDGSVEQVIMSGYHHFATARSGDDLSLEASYSDDPTHVRVRVVDPWHHFNFLDDESAGTARVTSIASLQSWLDVRDGWYGDGVFAASSQDAVDDPYVMRDRELWWGDGSDDAAWARRWLDWAPDWLSLGSLPGPTDADDDLRV